MSILAILAAAAPLVQAGSTVYGGIMQNKAIEEANAKNLAIYEKEQKETAKNNAILAGQNQQQIDLSRQNAAWQKKQADIENKRIENETNYNRLQKAANRFAEFKNSQLNINAAQQAGLQRT